MKIEDLRPAEGSRKKNKRVGRGVGSGHGKTSCRGHKGQKARSGGTRGRGLGFEGGQMPLQRRIPKRGFKNRFKKEYAIVNLKDINRIESLDVITPEILVERGIIKDLKDGIKVLGVGEIKRPLTIKADAFSASTRAKVNAAGGKVEII
ncbi:MAG: 50S ribosomal protein L15 [Thermodesulfovibrio sp. RBG_19FT_COMBO_42_12]|nr:MAG: 50S ribosomal protein L15 [Thermodesulfovibrio sp. RBG_19FT_COMBO_42_12]